MTRDEWERLMEEEQEEREIEASHLRTVDGNTAENKPKERMNN